MVDSRLNTFERKYYGRIFVEKEEDIDIIKDIMREINEDEFDNYYPTTKNPQDELITVFSDNNLESVYTYKFDEMDLGEVCIRAWKRGVKCFYISGKITGFEGDF